MAFATIGAAVTTNSASSFATTAHSINMPVVNFGDRLFVWIVGYKATNPPLDRAAWLGFNGWDLIRGNDYNNGYNMEFGLWTKFCDGTEGASTLDITTDLGCKLIATAFAVEGGGNYDWTEFNVSVQEDYASTTTPVTITPSWGSTPDTTVITFTMSGYNYEELATSGESTGYTNHSEIYHDDTVNHFNDHAGLYVQYKNTNVTTESPGAITYNGTVGLRTYTICLRKPDLATAIDSTSYMAVNLADDTVYQSLATTNTNEYVSLTKLMSVQVIRDNYSQAQLEAAQRTIVADDHVGGTGPTINTNDDIYLNDLVLAMMCPSSNKAAMAMAAEVGEDLFGAGTHAQFITEFLDAMDAKGTALGLTTPAGGWASPDGFSTENIGSTADVATIVKALHTDTYVRSFMGLHNGSFDVTGGRTATETFDHSMVDSGFLSDSAELSLKDGSASLFNGVLIWDTPGGDSVAFITMDSGSASLREDDLYALIAKTLDSNPELLGEATSITIPTASIAITGYAPTVAVATPMASIEVPTATMTITGLAPTITTAAAGIDGELRATITTSVLMSGTSSTKALLTGTPKNRH